MFGFSPFEQNISNWKINPNCETTNITTLTNMSDSYKPKLY